MDTSMVIWDLYYSEETSRLRYKSAGPYSREKAETVILGMKLAGKDDCTIVEIKGGEA
jgi:hypothetical protein